MSTNLITAITELDKSNFKTKIYAGGHFIYADEPESIGGSDEGMTPGALLLASLGSCTAITIRMYADRKKWELTETMIDVDFENEPAVKTAKMVVNIRLFGNLDEKQRERLLEIAHKCPIHKLLEKSIEINVHLKD